MYYITNKDKYTYFLNKKATKIVAFVVPTNQSEMES